MKRHELDLVSLIAGIVFLLVAAAYLLGAVVDYDLSLEWVVPALLIGVGAAGLAGSLRPVARESRDEVTPSADEPTSTAL